MLCFLSVQTSMNATVPVRITVVPMQLVLMLLAAIIVSVTVATLGMASCAKVYLYLFTNLVLFGSKHNVVVHHLVQ